MAALTDMISGVQAAAEDVPASRYTVGVELGGTKTIAVLGCNGTIIERVIVPTTTPAETLGLLGHRLRQWHERYRPVALGIASFGPISLNGRHGQRGTMLPNPKPGWSTADILGPLGEALPVPATLHTDVTAAALAEGRWGAAKGLRDYVYVTVGTGIGMGIIADGRPLAGRMHPEAGHMHVRRLPGDTFGGVCPFHGDCLEGLASGPAVSARAGVHGEGLSPTDPAWIPVSDALAEACTVLLLTLSCERIVIGGGVGVGQPHLLPMVRAGIVAKLGGYLPGIDATTVGEIIVAAALAGDAGPLGALLLADQLND
jgi:fructokinase